MTDTNNGWPGKPGVPRDPERNGYHRLKSLEGNKDFILEWSASNGWITMLRWSVDTIVEFMAYVGPVLTLAEEEALQKKGCARDQNTTQFCAEATALQARVAELEGLIRAVHRNAKNLAGDRTFDQCITALGHIDDLCRATL